ncbi:MAG TPA: hypothetical protein VGD40_01405 [Chryseosolibacter sp.]
MTIRNKSILATVSLLILFMIQASSCKPDLRDDAIPYLTFGSVYMNLNLPEYTSLKTDGGFYYYDDAGVRGLIIYRQNASTYHVYERNCSFQPNEACATVNVHVTRLFMEDPCCQSHFDFITGNPTQGAAWRPLRKYFSAVNGTDLTITDEIIQ